MDENTVELSRGALNSIFNMVKVEKPVLRLSDFQQASGDDPKSMFVLQLTDGESTYDNCVVHCPQLIQRLREGEFDKSCAVVLNEYNVNNLVQFLYVKDMSLAETEVHVIQTECHQNEEFVVREEENVANSSTSSEPQIISSSSVPQNISPSSEPQGIASSSEPQNIGHDIEVIFERISSQKESKPIISSNRLPEISSSQPSDVIPINTIATTLGNSWTIRGRITSKGKRRRWDNHNGVGQVFSFVISDQSGEILVKAFNRLCDKYYNLIEENKVYRISDGSVKMADKRYSNLSNDFDINLTSDSRVVECSPEEAFQVTVCNPSYKFVSIKDLLQTRVGEVVDVIGAVVDIGQCFWISTKQSVNRKLAKRDVTLMDSTDTDICLTLWKEFAEQFDCQQNSIIAVQRAVLKDFGGKSLSSIPNTNIKIEPDVPEANQIREWLSRRTANESLMTEDLSDQSVSHTSPINRPIARPANSAGRIPVSLLDQISEDSICVKKQSVYYVRARVSFPVNRSPLYKSCRKSRCFKKVLELPNGVYRCNKCVEETPHFQWRLFLAAVLIDPTVERWIHLFDCEATRLIGCTAQQLSQFTEQEQYEKVLHSIEYKSYLWKIGAKIQKYLNETSIKLNVLDFWPTDPIKDSKELIKNIRKMTENNE